MQGHKAIHAASRSVRATSLGCHYVATTGARAGTFVANGHAASGWRCSTAHRARDHATSTTPNLTGFP